MSRYSVLALCLMIFQVVTQTTFAEQFVIQVRDKETSAPERRTVEIKPEETVIVIIDMWEKHWCKTHTLRNAALIPRMNETLDAARELGFHIVMAPSDVANFYKDTPQRKTIQNLPRHSITASVSFSPGPRPQGEDRCECGPDRPESSHRAWSRQHEDLTIRDGDMIGDCNNENELLNLIESKGIKNIIYAGTASNMCICTRAFGMFNMKRYGVNTYFIRDLVCSITANGVHPATLEPDANFTPAKGTVRTEYYLESYVSPSLTSDQFLDKVSKQPRKTQPRIVIVVADEEYDTLNSLTKFAKDHLESDAEVIILSASEEDGDRIDGLDALYDADLLILSMRRRFMHAAQIDRLERYIRAEKPLIAIRTAITPFAEGSSRKRSKVGQVVWQNFDREVLGANYNFYDSAARKTGSDIWVADGVKDHPVFQGIEETHFHTPTWIYRVSPLAEDCTVLVEGRWKDGIPAEPVAWVRDRELGPVFYTSLGHAEDFESTEFNRFLKNAAWWALEQGDRKQKSLTNQ